MMKKYNVLLPIAGEAVRFKKEGYKNPKPLISIDDKHIIDYALSSFNIEDCNLIFAVRVDHIHNFSLDAILKKKFGEDIKIVPIHGTTRGALETCFLAKEYIDDDLPLFIYTPDVYFEDQLDPATVVEKDLDGYLLTFKANNPAHSYVQLDEDGYAIKTAEKFVISQDAVVGVYYYRSGKMFLRYAEKFIREGELVNNELYICPMYNHMIEDGLKIGAQRVAKMHVLGTPQDLTFFINNVKPVFGSKPIALCSDHSGYELKKTTIEILEEMGLPYIDFGCYTEQDCDYGGYVSVAIEAMKRRSCDFSFGFCKTGQGVNIYANNFKGVRAALIFDEYTAEYAVRHNCANFFSLPSKYLNKESVKKIINILRTNTFDGGRHMTRINNA